MVVGALRPGRWRGSSVISRGEELGALSPRSCLSFISCKGEMKTVPESVHKYASAQSFSLETLRPKRAGFVLESGACREEGLQGEWATLDPFLGPPVPAMPSLLTPQLQPPG